ncbi:hypothetical protein GCM10028809_03460 [Spirosoma gilvum]
MVSFDLRINSLVVPNPANLLTVFILCGNFSQIMTYSLANVGSTFSLSALIAGSNGGGVITIIASIGADDGQIPTSSYSIDIDNFTTNAAPDPANSCYQALPVRLISFTAQQAGQQIKLAWATATEQNSKGFEIQRGADARQWQPVGFVNSEKPSSNTSIKYSWYDEVPLTGINYYRLRQTDLDGSSQYSKIQAVAFSAEGPILIVPNPTTERVMIRNVTAETFSTIRVLDSNGRVLYTSASLPTDGIDVKQLLPGVYYVHIVTTYGQTQIQKLVKQ